MQNIIKHCLPGEGNGDESWFSRLNAFAQQETRRQVAFKRRHWPDLEDGVWSKQPNYQYPHILPKNNVAKALYQPITAQLIKYIENEDIALHTEALNLRSSQVCCFNILFPLNEDKELGKLVLAPLLPHVKTIEAIEFEYTGPDGATKWLGEPPCGKRGQNRTSIDAAIRWKDSAETQHITLLEWKYTEKSFGSCGGHQSDSNATKERCHALDLNNMNPESECFLTTGRPQTSRRYWEHLTEAGIDMLKLKGIKGCPFVGPFYQLLRQSLLAAYLRQEFAYTVSMEIVVLSFEKNTSLLDCPPYLRSVVSNNEGSTIINTWNTVMPDAPPIRHVTIEEIMQATDLALPRGNDWRSYVKERYGV